MLVPAAAMSALLSAIHNAGLYHVRPRPPPCRPRASDLQTTGTTAAVSCAWLRSIWRHLTYARSPKIQRIDCNELARNLLPGWLVCFFFDRVLAKVRAGSERTRAPTGGV